jgi:hypothetical protein
MSVTNLTLTVASEVNYTSSQLKPLPSITLNSDQPTINVTISVPTGTVKVQVSASFCNVEHHYRNLILQM